MPTLKANWKYWTTDRPFIEGESVPHDSEPPVDLRVGWVFTDEHGQIKKFKPHGGTHQVEGLT